MFGRIVFSESRKVALRQEELSGVLFQTVCIPLRGAAGRRIRKASRLFTRSGVRRVIAPADFPYWPQLENCGIVPLDIAPFLQAMAVPIALAFLYGCGIAPEQATVMLAGQRASNAVWNAALGLSSRIQQLVVFAPAGGTKLADYLRREYGIPQLEQCRDPQLVLQFSNVQLDAKAPVLCMHGPAPDLLGVSLYPKTFVPPADCELLPLLSALWECGRIAVQDIAVFPKQGT